MSAARLFVGDFQIDLANRQLLHREREVALEPRVFAVIAQLLRRPGELVTRNELLDSIWGHRYVTPSTLNRTITLARRAFGDDVSEPRYIQTVHGAGYRFVGPDPVVESAPLSLQARFEPPFAARLPARIQTLIGRESELAALGEMLRHHRTVTVLGAGGMGKTQCALEAARRGASAFPDGVWFFDLSPLQHASEWLRLFGAALALPAATPDPLIPQLGALLRERQALIVLDNCERIAADLGAILFLLLRAAGSLRFLATSQRPLNLLGEQILRMPPLRVPDRGALETLSPEGVGGYAAVALLLMRIRAVRPDFDIDATNAAVLSEICQRLDGMPLALELAAARFALLSPQQVLERLVQRFRFLEDDSAGRDRRHGNLRTLLEWSYGLLSLEEQRLLNWSAVFVETWSTEAFIALAAALGHEPEAAVDLLSGLVSHSLVGVMTDVTPPRYRLLESVRAYALLQLRGSGKEEIARLAHLDAMTSVCRRAREGMLGGRMRECVEQLVLDRGNLQAALECAATLGTDQPQALEILGSLLLYGKGHGDYMTVYRWCRAVLDPAGGSESAARARALLTLGVIQMHLGPEGTWLGSALADAARIAAMHGDWWTEAYAFGYLALREANELQVGEAEICASRTRVIAERHGDELLRGLAGLAQGWVSLAKGRLQQAVVELTVARELGVDPHQRHFIAVYVGLAQFELGCYPMAAQQWLAGLNLSGSVGNVRGMAGSVEGCGYLACKAADWHTATRLLAGARAIRERTGLPLFKFWLPHHEAALRELRLHLSTDEFEACQHAGVALRQEDSINEARSLLQAYSNSTAPRGMVTPS